MEPGEHVARRLLKYFLGGSFHLVSDSGEVLGNANRILSLQELREVTLDRGSKSISRSSTSSWKCGSGEGRLGRTDEVQKIIK
jgi:hypothetical protein